MKPVYQLLTKMPYGLAGTIYRSPLPFSPLYDPRGILLEAYLDAGVDVVVMLTPEDEARKLTGQDLRARFEDLGLTVIYAPVPDFLIPGGSEFQATLDKTLQAARAGQTIVIHCHAGIGRTGIFTACLARIVFNLTGEEAVSWVRQVIPHAVENDQQFQFIQAFEIPQD